jgi:peptidoglycan/LPS O-acetylase OafA/YrhL
MKRIPELDGIRAVAVGMVLVCHTRYLENQAPRFAGLMVVGVDLFFVLSGYLITEIILRNQAQPGFLTNFYMRRSLRIWPIYYLFLAVHFVGVMVAGPEAGSAARSPGEVARFLTFTQTLPFSPSVTSAYVVLRHTWSLSVEEQFYLFWPFLTLLLPRKWLGAGLGAIVVGAVLVRFFAKVDVGVGEYQGAIVVGAVLVRFVPTQELQNITSRADGLALGALLALVLHRRAWAGSRPGVLWAYLIVIMAAAATGPFWSRAIYKGLGRAFGLGVPGSVRFSLDLFFFNVCGAGVVGLAVCRSGSLWLWPLRNRFLCRVGLLSYGIYLYHPPILRLVSEWLDPSGRSFLTAALGWCLSYGVAELSWACVEQPVLRLKDRFDYRPRPSPAPPPTPSPEAADAHALPAAAAMAEPPGA